MEDTSNFLFDIIQSDLDNGVIDKVATRFPPEPNGYLHIGHTKAIYVNFTAASKFGGTFNLRFDDTNPRKEGDEYVNSIKNDLVWLTGKQPDNIFFGSDYFEKCYEYAVKLIKDGKAYVCDLNEEEMREYRGSLTQPGRESPYRNRTIEENLTLFEKMKNGEFPDGFCTLRAKIDMSSPNINMRDPAIYRILRATHHRQGDKWCIYPLYDYAHPIQDAIEGITHSMCSIEFENHRPLYDWVVNNIGFVKPPHQYEFAKMYITNTVMSKRYLRKLVETNVVSGWDDPRMPTLCGLRRRGCTPSAIFDFVSRAGIAKTYSLIDSALLDHCIREELNMTAQRAVAVLDPVPVTITNYPEDKVEYFELPNNPNDENAGKRKLPFTKELFIEREDVSLNPPPKFHRLKPDGEVRLMGSYIIKFVSADTDADGNITRVYCTADIESGCGNPTDGRKIKGTIHWLSEMDSGECEVRFYDKLFTIENTGDIGEDESYDDYLNKNSETVLKNCRIEQLLVNAKGGDRFQFVRTGYFCKDTKSDAFIRTVALKDSK